MWMKKGVKIAIIAPVFLAVFAMGGFVLNVLIGKPSSNEMLAYMEKVYGKDFEIIEEFTYISYTDGEPEFQRELENPASGGEEQTEMIYYAKDKKIDGMDEFSDFLDGKTAAYDEKQQGERYCTDYYEEYIKEYHGIFAIGIMAEDMNGDKKDELLMIIMHTSDQGDLYVFHEQDGKLYTWEVLKNFFTMRIGNVYLLENGTFEFFGRYGQGHFFKRYNEKGEVEDVLDYYYDCQPWEDVLRYDYVLTTYEQGLPARELEYSIIALKDKSPDKGEMLLGTKEIQEECDRILDEFYEESERLREIRFIQYEEDVEEIALNDLLKRQGE